MFVGFGWFFLNGRESCVLCKCSVETAIAVSLNQEEIGEIML